MSTLRPVMSDQMRTLMDREVSEFAVMMEEIGPAAKCETDHDRNGFPCSIEVVAIVTPSCIPEAAGVVCQNTVDWARASTAHPCWGCLSRGRIKTCAACWAIRPI